MTPQPRELPQAGRGSFRLSLRIARRDAAQHRARSILVIALVAIPIIGLSAVATIESSNTPTARETIRDTLGNSQAKLTVVSQPDPTLKQDPVDPSMYENNNSNGDFSNAAAPPSAPVSSYLPAGTSILSLRPLAVIADTATGIGSLSAIEGEPWNSAFVGRFVVLSGHTPTSSDEVMTTPAALTRLGVKIGQTVTITQPRVRSFTVVGTMRDLTEPSSAEQLFARAAAIDGVAPENDLLSTSFYLPTMPVNWAAIQRLNSDGITVLSREVLLNPPPSNGIGSDQGGGLAASGSLVLILPIVGFSLFEVALLAGAAFTVSAQQQQRALATLASVGGDRRMLARVVSASGVVLGLAGGLVGTVLGIGAAAAYMQVTADGSIACYPGLHVDPLVTAGIIAFAVIAGWLAALVPARRAARIDVVSSLRGAARPGIPLRRTPLIGILVGILGIGLTVAGSVLVTVLAGSNPTKPTLQQLTIGLLVAGPILLQLAALIVTPLLLRTVARLLSRAGTPARLASRDIARNAPRSVPAVGAIMSTIFVASFLITYTAAAQAEVIRDYDYQTAPGIVSAGGGYFGLQSSMSRAQAKALATAMDSTLHATDAQILYGAQNPDFGGTPAAGARYPVPVIDPSVRCPRPPAGTESSSHRSRSIDSAECQGPQFLIDPEERTHISVGSVAAMEIAIGAKLTAASRSALADGKVVAFYPEYVHNGAATISWLTTKQMQDDNFPSAAHARTVTVPAVVQTPPRPVFFGLLMTPATAHSLGIVSVPVQIIARTGIGPSGAQSDALGAAAQAVFGKPGSVNFSYEGGPAVFASETQWALLALCLLIAIGSAAVALGLARTEGRRDEAVLGSLGAPPRLRRAYAFWSAAVIAGVGSIGGGILGAVPGLAISGPLNVQQGGHAAPPFDVPWLPLLIAAAGLPLLLAIGGWLTAGRGRIRYNVRAPIE